MDVSSEDTTSAAERHVRDIPIHGGVNNWYIDVLEPPRSYRIDIGYLSRRGRFYVLARSNVVTTPKAGVTDTLDENWTNVQKQFERIQNPSSNGNGNGTTHHNTQIDLRDLFEERLRRPMNSATLQNLATSALPHLGRDFHFQIDAELIVYGTTEPNAQVTLQGEPVQLRNDGTFTVRFSLPDSRQIIPAVAVQCRRHRRANDRAGRGTQYQRTRADDPRQQRDLTGTRRALTSARRVGVIDGPRTRLNWSRCSQTPCVSILRGSRCAASLFGRFRLGWVQSKSRSFHGRPVRPPAPRPPPDREIVRLSQDIEGILDGWEFEPDGLQVRIITGDDGTEKIQMRIDLGLIQMEMDGRPDGQRPGGSSSRSWTSMKPKRNRRSTRQLRFR